MTNDELKDRAFLRRVATEMGDIRQRALSGNETGEEMRKAIVKSLSELISATDDLKPGNKTVGELREEMMELLIEFT